jgi:hypothetical protein
MLSEQNSRKKKKLRILFATMGVICNGTAKKNSVVILNGYYILSLLPDNGTNYRYGGCIQYGTVIQDDSKLPVSL